MTDNADDKAFARNLFNKTTPTDPADQTDPETTAPTPEPDTFISRLFNHAD